MKKTLSALLALILALSLCAGAAFAAPPAPPTKEADDYTGPVITYPDKELWFDTTVYGGFYSAYQIMKSNGDESFDIDAFINSKQGELVLSRIKYELCTLGNDQVASQFMIDYWAGRGIIETPYNMDDIEHAWITYVPEYMYAEENAGKVYPVVFSQHGGGGTLFEATNHGFVDICYDEGFIVVVTDNEGSTMSVASKNVSYYLDELEKNGYPIDRTRVYMSGMSLGGGCTITAGVENSDIIAAIAPHSSSYTLMLDGVSIDDAFLGGGYRTMTGSISQEKIDSCNGMPMWLQIGGSDMGQLPMRPEVMEGLNAWLAMNDCPTKATATDSNAIGITADRVYTAELDGTTYTFAEFYNTAGVKTMVIVGVAGLPHWVSYSFSKLAWDFMSQYSIVDGQRVYTAKTPTYYSDVENDADYAAAVQTVTEAGLMKGIGVNTFAPDGTVTRAQAITVLGRLANAVPTDVYGIADVKPGSWYSGYVGWAVSNGIVKLDDGRFDPNGTLTGTELDEIFRAYGDLIGVDYINFPNNNNTMSFGPTGPVFAPSTEPVTRSELASRLVKLMNAPVDYDYEGKELWFDTTVYGGFYSAYQIMKGNGDNTFNIDAFINSKQGELTLSRIKYELCTLGDDQVASQFMIDYWASRGIIETPYNMDDTEHAWITYVPDYMMAKDNTELYPVVFCHHGSGGTLFEATDHGFVDICYDEGFMVVVPENENSDPDVSIEMLPKYLDELEAKGYPIDRSRIYVAGMSKGAATSLKVGLACSDIVAAIAPHSASFGMLMEGSTIQSYLRGNIITMNGSITQEQLDNCGGMPIWMQVGESDMNQLPFAQGMIDSLNDWLAMNDCPTKATATDSNIIGITADKVYTVELDGTTYTFAEYYNTAGVKTMVVVGVEGLPHWVSYSYSRLAWNFMKNFSK